MATNNESVYVDCENEFFETALEKLFTDLTLNGDECEELSRITNNVLTSDSENTIASRDDDQTDDYYHLALSPDCAKDYFQSSTPKREHELIRSQRKHKLLVRFTEYKQASDESDVDSNCSNSQTSASSSVEVTPEVPSLSVIIRDHQRQLILSPFSQHLKNAILRQESMRKREQRIADSKKAQRASLRV